MTAKIISMSTPNYELMDSGGPEKVMFLTPFGPQDSIVEFAGRVCYDSLGNTGRFSNYIEKRIVEGHEDILEHVHIALSSFIHPREMSSDRFLFAGENGPDGSFVYFANARTWRRLIVDPVAEKEFAPVLASAMPKTFPEYTADGTEIEDVEMFCKCSTNFGMRVALIAHTMPIVEGSSMNSATFLLDGISRAMTHQLVRHRLMQFSQMSQRYVEMRDPKYRPVIPFHLDDTQKAALERMWEEIRGFYIELRDVHRLRKEDAWAVLPNMAPTRVVVTGTYEALRHFFWLRALDKAAQKEIRIIAQQMMIMCAKMNPVYWANEMNHFYNHMTELAK